MSKCSRLRAERVVNRDEAVAFRCADPVEQQVHGADPSGRIHDLPSPESFVAQEPLLVGVEAIRLHVLVGREQEASGTRSRVATRMPAVGLITSTMALINSRGVKYWPAPVFTSSAFLASSPS